MIFNLFIFFMDDLYDINFNLTVNFIKCVFVIMLFMICASCTKLSTTRIHQKETGDGMIQANLLLLSRSKIIINIVCN
jgi:hypothetical protein